MIKPRWTSDSFLTWIRWMLLSALVALVSICVPLLNAELLNSAVAQIPLQNAHSLSIYGLFPAAAVSVCLLAWRLRLWRTSRSAERSQFIRADSERRS
jgi:hypothetical protein